MSHSFSFLPRGRFMLWALLLALPLCAYGGSGESPESVVEAGIWATTENRAEDFIKLCSPDAKQKARESQGAEDPLRRMVQKDYEKAQKRGGLKSVKTELLEQKGDTAAVKFDLTFGNGQTEMGTVPLVKESGKWKLVFH